MDNAARKKNGFLIRGGLIPAQDIKSGGVPRDGIPAIYSPVFIKAGEQQDLESDDRVLGISVGGISKAFPVAIMDRHEVVNDQSGDTAFAAVW